MKSLFKILFSIFIVINIILFTDKMISSAYTTLMLWFNTVIPSLFPFMVISSWLDFGVKSKITPVDKITYSLLGIPASLMPVFIISVLAGYPTGAKLISELYSKKQISISTAQHLLAFSNNAGIVFILSAVASSMLQDKYSSIFFISIIVISSLVSGVIFNMFCPPTIKPNETNSYIKPKRTSFGDAISSAVKAILTVGGCMIFFAVITEAVTGFFANTDSLLYGIISGIFEFTRGISLIAKSSIDKRLCYSIIAALLSWGGLSVHLQTAAVISTDDLSILKYIICKAFSSVISFLSAYITYDLFFRNIDSVTVFNEISYVSSPFIASILLCTLILLINRLTQKRDSI